MKTERRLVHERRRQEIVRGRRGASGRATASASARAGIDAGEPPDVLERSEARAEADQIASVGMAERRRGS